MPIVRREDQPDRLSSQALYLWSRRWSLILPALVVAIGTFFITGLLREEFVATGQVFVNRFAANDDDTLLPNPGSVTRLLESDLLIRRVRDEFISRYGGDVRHMPIEQFGKQFKVKSEVLQDTSVKKEISPVLQLSVQATGAEQTKFLMESWLRNFVQMFGSYATMEAVEKRNSLQAENADLEQRLETAEQELARIDVALPMNQKLLQELMNTVASADLPPRFRSSQVPLPSGSEGGAVTGQNTQVNLSMGLRPPGLASRLVNLKIEETLAGDGAATRSLEQVRAEQRAVAAAIHDTQTSIAELQGKVAEAVARSNSLERQIRMLTQYQAELRQRLSKFSIASSVYRQGGEDTGVGADARVLAGPVTPELKVWPRRTLTSLGAGIAAFLLSAIVLLALQAMRGAAVSRPPKAMAEAGV